jgi:lysophospholipase L1-like esterase
MPFLYYRHGRLGYALVRNSDYYRWVHVDREGFRGPEVNLNKAPGTLRVMIVGASTVFDSYVTRDSAAWAARLQFWLQTLAPGLRVEVVNAGVPGYRVVDHLIRLETELFAYKPDVIVLYEAHNDLFAALRRGNEGPARETSTPSEIPPVAPWTYWLDRHSLLYTKLLERWNVIKFERLAPSRPTSETVSVGPGERAIEAGAEQFERDVADFVVVARALGIRVILAEVVNVSGVRALQEPDSAVRSTWWHTVPFAGPDVVLRGYARYRAALRAIADRFSLPLIPAGPFGLEGTSFYAEDDPIHFNDRGADRMGHEMARALLTAHLLDLQPTAKSEQ